MKAPLLANHCIMEGFEDGGEDEAGEAADEAAAAIKELLPPNEIAKLEIAKKSPDGVYIISMPEITEALGQEDSAPTDPVSAPAPAATPAPLEPPTVKQVRPIVNSSFRGKVSRRSRMLRHCADVMDDGTSCNRQMSLLDHVLKADKLIAILTPFNLTYREIF